MALLKFKEFCIFDGNKNKMKFENIRFQKGTQDITTTQMKDGRYKLFRNDVWDFANKHITLHKKTRASFHIMFEQDVFIRVAMIDTNPKTPAHVKKINLEFQNLLSQECNEVWTKHFGEKD